MDEGGATREELLREVRDLRRRLAGAEAESLRSIVEHSTNVFYSHTPEHVLTYMSPQARDLFGYEPDELLVRWTELATGDPRNALGLEATQRAIDTGERQAPYELELRRKDGGRVLVEVHEAPVVEDGKVVAIVGALTDITQRRRMERLVRVELGSSLVLASSRSLDDVWERVLEGALTVDEVDAAGVYVVEPETGALRLACHRGLSDAFLDQARCLPASDPRVQRVAAAPGRHFVYEDALCRSEGLRAVGVFPVRDGERLLACLNVATRSVRSFSVPVLNALDTVVSQAGPIVTRLHAESSLRRSEAMLRGVFRSAPAGMGLVVNRTFEWVNDHMTRMTGYTQEELTGRSARMLYPTDEEFDRVGRVKYGQIAHAGTGSVETTWLRKDGKKILVHLSSSTLDPEDEDVGTVFTAWDVTEQRRSEADRRRLEAQVQHAQKLESLGVLAGGIAHDFNNILHAILGNAHLAGRHLPESSRARAYLDEVQRSVDRAAGLCNQMLAYSGKGSFVMRPLGLGDVVRDIAAMLEVSISKKASLSLEIDEDLPAIEADASQMRQIVMNLITNASEALGGEEGRIHIRIRSIACGEEDLADTEHDGEPAQPGRYVVLSVRDTGCGMDAETRSRVFEPFFTTKFAGRGLGMAAVQGIVRAHGGAIRLESRPGEGTTVTVLLPVADVPAGPSDETAVVPDAEPGVGTVLFADDEPALLALGRAWLENGGYVVVTAADGRAAVDAFRDNPHVITAAVLDLTMPRMDGEEAFRALRAVRPNLPVILVSGYSEQELRGRFDSDAPAGFLQKPFNGEELLRVLASVLAS